MKRIILVSGLVMALTGSAYAVEQDSDAQMALIKQCDERANDAGLVGEDREAFIASCAADNKQKPASEEG